MNLPLGQTVDVTANAESATTGRTTGLGSLRRRVLAASGALVFGQGVSAAIQLLSLPLFLHFWDAGRYGKWVLLSAVPVYFSMSDGGMIPVAANRITMLEAAGDRAGANVVFQSALALVLAAIGLVGAGSAFVLLAIGDGVLDGESRLALWLLVFATLMGLFGGMFEAAFRAFGSYAQGVMFGNFIRILEFLGMAIGMLTFASFVAAAAGTLAGRCLGSIALVWHCRRRFPALRWSLQEASRAELRALLHPALGFLAFPFGNALSLQGITLVVGALFGTSVVAVFNTYRTLSRLVLQLVATLGHALWTEFSRLYGAAQRERLRGVYRRTLELNCVISAACSLAMIPAAPVLLRIWTHGKIGFEAPLFIAFALATLFGGVAHLPRVLLLSTNRHSRLGVMYFTLSAACVLATLPAGSLAGPLGAAATSATLEAALLLLSLHYAAAILDSLPPESDHV